MSQNDTPENEIVEKGIRPVSIVEEMRQSFIAYSMSVITSRALPDVRDGLKPVHRRILYSMHESGLHAGAKFRKSATVVGAVIGSYHPHGDSSVYDAMAKMAQGFSYRYPLVIGQGNFGSVDGDRPAAYRYTEAKMSKLSSQILRDIQKDTVDFRNNFDGSKQEPTVLPSAVPALLLNGVLGIAVGMASNIPPHNLGEVLDAAIHIADNPKATNEDLMEHVQGPDFPLGGMVFDKKAIAHAYANGRGGVVTRGDAEIVEDKKGNANIIISSIPYQVNRSNLVMKIAELVQTKKVQGIKDLRDESTEDTRIVVVLKSGTIPQRILNVLYKHTDLETTFNYNMTALVDGVPQTVSLKEVLVHFIEHRRVVVVRRTQFDLAKAEARAHILEGLKKALDHIDEVITIIKKSKDKEDARKNLIKRFKFSDIQADAILDMRLQKLAGLERKAIEDELKEKLKIIKELKALLADPKKILKVITEELAEIKEKYADDRRTRVIKGGVKTLADEDLIPDKEATLVFTRGGYVKRTDADEYRAQRRGGRGVSDMNTKEEDVITHVLAASSHSDILFFTTKGKVHSVKMYEIPEAKRTGRGKSVHNFIQLEEDETVTSILAMPKDVKKQDDLSLILVTEQGTVKKTGAEHFRNIRSSGLIAVSLKGDDVLMDARFVSAGEQVVLVTRRGQSIRFQEKDARQMGRSAAGVKGISLKDDDMVVGMGIVPKDASSATLLAVTERGYGKQTQIDEYKIQGRGGSGIKTAQLTEKTGLLVGARVVVDQESELIAISTGGVIIRTPVSDISHIGRATQGVRIMKLGKDDTLAAIALL